MKVPFLDLPQQIAALRPELDAAIAEVIDRGDFIGGRAVDAFEREFAQYCGTEHCVGVGSGTAALTLGLHALGIGPGDEVVTAANTFAATAFAILETGARPVLVDPDPDTCNMTAAGVEAAFTARTRAIIPVHLYGRLAPMASLVALAERRSIRVLEDACQAHGAAHEGTRAGAFGDAAAFSFYPGKNLGAFGDGGAITTNAEAVAANARCRRNLGAVEKYRHEIAAPNERLDTVHAAVLRVKLAHLDRWNAGRAQAAAAYTEALEGLPLTCPAPAPAGAHVYHLYVVFTEDEATRDALRTHLAGAEIQTGMHYPIALPDLPALRDVVPEPAAFPLSRRQACTGVSLPMFPELSTAQIGAVTESIRGFFEA